MNLNSPITNFSVSFLVSFLVSFRKVEKLESNSYDIKECIVHIRTLKQALNHRLLFKKVHGVIKSNQKWLAKTKNWYKFRAKIKCKQ